MKCDTTSNRSNTRTRTNTPPVGSLESLSRLHPDKQLIALSMPKNKAFHHKVTAHWKKAKTYRCKQLFASWCELEFESTGIPKQFEVDGQTVEAMVFQFKRMRY